jgi:hypothetical protein
VTHQSERDVVIGDALIGIILSVRRLGLSSRRSIPYITPAIAGVPVAVFRTAAQEREVIYEDLGPIFLLSGFPVIPRAGLDFALDQQPGALPNIVADNFGGAVDGDEVVPLSLVMPVALAVLLMIGRSN